MSALWMIFSLVTARAQVPVAQNDVGSVGEDAPEEDLEIPVETTPVWGVINGTEADEDDFPMTGGMLMDARLDFGGRGAYDMRSFVCSSTLIAPDVVLLAAHCVDPYVMTYGFGEIEDVDIRWSRQADLSDHDGSSISDWPSDAVTAWDWVMYPDWDITAMDVGLAENHDLALLFLDEPVLDVPHAYLVSAEERTQIEEGSQVEVVGWGQQVATGMWEQSPPGTYGFKMQGVSFINELGETEFQVGAEEDDVRKCHGDSGGPTFMHVETDAVETQRLIGVTSHAYDASDCESVGGVDTRVDAYLEWIEAELVARCADGSRAWCDETGIVYAPLPTLADSDTGGESGRGGCACATPQAPMTRGWAWLLGMLGLFVARRR